MEQIISMIQGVGFPIVAFLIAAYGLKYAYDKSMEQEARNCDTIAKLADAVNHNTLVLTELVTELRKDDED